MPIFRYKAVTPTGEIVEGAMEAGSQTAVVLRLQDQGHVPIRAHAAASSGLVERLRTAGILTWPQRRADLVMLTRQLAKLLGCGLTLDRALEICCRLGATDTDCKAAQQLRDKIQSGSTLADAMAAQAETFPPFYVGIVRAGEASATLDANLEHLAGFLERTKRRRDEVKSALTYPAIVVLTSLASLAVLLGFVVPSFEPLFKDSDAKLPFVTTLVLAVAQAVAAGWWAMLIAALLIGLGLTWWLRGNVGRAWRDRHVLRVPVLGPILRKAEFGRFALTLGTLLKSGVSPLTALAIAQGTLRNRELVDAVTAAVAGVSEGKGLAEPLAQTGAAPPLAIQLIRVGEETARLDEMLLETAGLLEDENRHAIERMLALLAPTLTVAVGVVVALVVSSILMAVLSVYELAL
jgi:general secretion pathway protein F